MTKKSDIIENFERVKFVFSNSFFALSPHTRASLISEDDFNTEIKRIKEDMQKNREFYDMYDYTWVLDKKNYTDGLDVSLQRSLLTIMSDIRKDHPYYHKLGNIAVRILSSGDVNSQCIIDDTYKYIILSSSFVTFIREIVYCIRQIYTASRNIDESVKCSLRTNYMRGQNIEKILRSHFDDCLIHIDRLIEAFLCHCIHALPSVKPFSLPDIINYDLKREKVDPFLVILYLSLDYVETFLICHELVHILHHDLTNRQRDAKEEFEADKYASSLFLIYCSNNMNNTNLSTLMYIYAPAIFFCFANLLSKCRYLFSLVGNYSSINRKFSKDEDIILASRMIMYGEYTKKWKLEDLSNTYYDICEEIWLLIKVVEYRALFWVINQNTRIPKQQDINKYIDSSIRETWEERLSVTA